MTETLYSPKIKPEHLARKAIVYLRQSSEKQVRQNKESQRLQYDVAERMRAWVGNKWRSSMVTLDAARPWPLLVGKDLSASSVRWH
jgi:hypothetical protein